jgi:hypothetical protein
VNANSPFIPSSSRDQLEGDKASGQVIAATLKDGVVLTLDCARR